MAESRTLNRFNSQHEQFHRGHVQPKSVVAMLFLASLMISSGTGCTAVSGLGNSLQYNECCNDFMLGFRNSAWSSRAWQEHKHCFKHQRYTQDFRAGFRAGYEDVASGGNGCTPAFPPRSYWGWKYQSPEGQLKVGAWFAGYPMGAKAAEEDGLGYHHDIQICGEMEQACQAHGLIPGVPATPVAQPHPTEQLPGMGALLGEGESIIGEVQVQPALTPTPPSSEESAVPASTLGSGLIDASEPTESADPI